MNTSGTKKLLQLNCTVNSGSTGKIAESIGLAAMKRGWESYMAYGRRMNHTQSNLIKVGNMPTVFAHYARYRFLDGEGLGSKFATKRLITQIEEIQPDIIQLHIIHDHWINYPLLFDYFTTIPTPIFWTLHDCWAFTGGCYHFENEGCYKWKTSGCKGGCPLNFKKTEKNFDLRLKALSEIGERLNIVCVSRWLADYASTSLLKSAGAKFNVINNGININGIFKPTEGKKKMVLGVSYPWSVRRSLDDFIKLRHILPENIEIVLVGLNKKQISSLPSGITGLLKTESGEELARLYSQASALINPTYNDSFPTVNLEALACGTPVITYRTGGSPEAIDEETGIVVEKGDVEGLSKATRHIIDNPEIYTVENCRRRAVKCFNQDIQFNKYIDLYEQELDI